MKTNLGLVEYAKLALSEKWGYVWGTFGLHLTDKLLQEKVRQYPREVGGKEAFIRKTWLNKRVADCAGLIKSYLWQTATGIEYNVIQDKAADTMFKVAERKGFINTLPETPGLILWKSGHVGIYTGQGEVIEANSTEKGVIKTLLTGVNSTSWTNWFELPGIKYVNNGTSWQEILKIVADDPQRWEIAINGLVLAAESGIVNEFYRHLPLLIEKIYNTSGP